MARPMAQMMMVVSPKMAPSIEGGQRPHPLFPRRGSHVVGRVSSGSIHGAEEQRSRGECAHSWVLSARVGTAERWKPAVQTLQSRPRWPAAHEALPGRSPPLQALAKGQRTAMAAATPVGR